MQAKSRQELYGALMDFIATDLLKQRSATNRRMLNVFLWCLVLPVVTSIALSILVNAGMLSRAFRPYLGWTILVFPVVYSLYILSAEVLVQIPTIFRRGAMAMTLGEAVQENLWRSATVEQLRRSVSADLLDWKWLVANLKIDLLRIEYRTKYLTALAGAVLFLILQGIDMLSGAENVQWVKSPMGWIETSSTDFSQVMVLALFLVLFYLSGNQAHRSLVRYLSCAEILVQDLENQDRS